MALWGLLRIWEGMAIYRERVLVMLELAINDLQQGLLFVPTPQHLLKRNADRTINQSCAARSPAPSRLASACNLSACCQLDWEQEGGTVAALFAEARKHWPPGSQDLTNSRRNRRWGWKRSWW